MDNLIATAELPATESIDRVVLTGSVVHKYRPHDNVIVLTVGLTGRNGTDAFYPNVTYYGKAAETIDKALVVEKGNYPRVNIEASIQTSKRIGTDGTAKYFQTIVGNTISLAQTNMETISGKRGVGKHKAASRNEVCLLGRVLHTYSVPSKINAEDPMCVILTLEVVANGRRHFPRVTIFDRNAKRTAVRLQRDDVVCVTGYVETRDRDTGRMESVIVEELELINE